MKTVNQAEVDKLVEEYQFLVGLELQQILLNSKAIHLQFYGGGQGHWLTFSYKPGNPYFFVSDSKVLRAKGEKKPLSLFCRRHLKGHCLVSLKRLIEVGRGIELTFGEGLSLQLILIPGRVNIIANAAGKSVFLKKPSEIKVQAFEYTAEVTELRTTADFIKEWLALGESGPKSAGGDQAKALKKKQAGLEKMHQKLEELKSDSWDRLGQLLKETGRLDDVPQELQDRIDENQSLSWNIENCFTKYKKNQLKIDGTLERIAQLEAEVARLLSGKAPEVRGSKSESLLHAAETRGRTLQIGATKLYIGRSGADNLKLLRKAKPWYLWLHIKDYPGAHGILEKERNKDSADESTLREAAQAVIKQSVPQGHRGRFEVIYAECRYVRPIKGAKSGQVTYSHEKVISVEV